MYKDLKILVSPLDWGLGHATRMISVLQLLDTRNELFIAVNKTTEAIMKEAFPKATFLSLPSYNIQNSHSTSYLSLWKLIPKLNIAKRKEKKWLHRYLKNHKVDLIISDSRFGFYHPSIKSIIISHQLQLPIPKGYNYLGKMAQKTNERWLSAFQEIWVPDNKDHQWSGKLSEQKGLKANFIGIQSRFSRKLLNSPLKKDYLLAILSGPEPQRSIFEKLLIGQQTENSIHLVIIGGTLKEKPETYKNITYFSNLSRDKMQAYIQNASGIISRSGYSSIMDYARLACKKVLFVPTPAQTEQEYLAQRMKKHQIADYIMQEDFDLQNLPFPSYEYHGFKE